LARNEVVSLEYRVNKAFEGKYYIGHAPVMTLRNTSAWAGLLNPKGSGINLFVNTFTVTNYSDTPLRAQLWVNAMPGSYQVSPHVSPTNTAKTPLREPKVQLAYQPGAGSAFSGGQSLFSRVAPGNDTVVGNYYGKIVIPPGGCFVALLYPPQSEVSAEVAFGWWEEGTARPY
jgi:hypothetical protein